MQLRGGGGGVVHAVAAFAFTVAVCFQVKNRQTEHTGRTCSDNYPHCQYSFELQRRQAEDPCVVYAMTLASTVDDFFQLKNRQREPIAWVLYAVTATFMHCKIFCELERRQLKEAMGRTCSDQHIQSPLKFAFS